LSSWAKATLWAAKPRRVAPKVSMRGTIPLKTLDRVAEVNTAQANSVMAQE